VQLRGRAILEEELIPMMQFFLARTEEIAMELFLFFDADLVRVEAQWLQTA